MSLLGIFAQEGLADVLLGVSAWTLLQETTFLSKRPEGPLAGPEVTTHSTGLEQ